MTLITILLAVCAVFLLVCGVMQGLQLRMLWQVYNAIMESRELPSFEDAPWREPDWPYG